MDNLTSKENAIFDILQRFLDASLDFVLVGGYAVSAYKHRFSTDADIVIQSKDLEKFESVLKKEKFTKGKEKDLVNPYSSRFMRYEKDFASVDLLIDALAARDTGAAFSYKLLFDQSSKRKVIGIEKDVTAMVPSKEIIIVMKIHSGRLTDFRDIAALAKDSDINKIKNFLFIGNQKVLQDQLNGLNMTVNNKNFVDSFKGVFMEKKFDVDMEQVEKISKLKFNE